MGTSAPRSPGRELCRSKDFDSHFPFFRAFLYSILWNVCLDFVIFIPSRFRIPMCGARTHGAIFLIAGAPSPAAMGFASMTGRPLEPLELYTLKSGEEIVGQLYNFVDKGERASPCARK